MMNSYKCDEFNNLIEALCYCKDRFSDNVAFIDGGRRITYYQFYQDVLKVWHNIKKANVVLNINNLYLFAVAFFACQFNKALPFVMNKVYEFAQFEMIIEDADVNRWIQAEKTVVPSDVVIAENSPAVVLLSSGTTKTPKPVVLSHKNLCSNVASGSRYYGYFEKWTCVNIIPVSHSFGLTCDLLGVLFSGGTVVSSRSIIDFFGNLSLYNPDFLNLPPSIVSVLYEMILKNGKAVVGKNLKKILVGGAKCSVELIDNFKNYGIDIYGCYGLTECSPCVSVNSELQSVVGSDGRILDCNTVRIADDGEIIIKGKNVMLNYYESYIKGIVLDEFYTNDIGYVENNYLYVQGRKDNLIILDNGYKIQPEILESKLNELASVEESVVILNKNNKIIIYAKVNNRNSDCLDEIISSYVYNHVYSVEFVDEIKKNKTGKIDRAFYKEL